MEKIGHVIVIVGLLMLVRWAQDAGVWDALIRWILLQ